VSAEDLRPCLQNGASMGKEVVLTDSGRVSEKAEHFEYPMELCFIVP